jgi:uncharacterized protein YkwD
MSVFAENRSRGRTDLEQLAADLERVFGKGSARIEHRETGKPPNQVATILAAMNDERATRGLTPLTLNPRLTAAASDRANDMFAKRYFAHVSPDGIEPFTWVRQRGYRYRTIGENLALGYRSGGAVVDGWMHSPGHRANILQRSFDEVGIAVADGSPRRGYRGPLVVALYGSRRAS